LYLSVRTYRPEYKNTMHPVGGYSLKPGLKILIYNVYGEGFGNKKSPASDKNFQKSTATDENLKTVNRFTYHQIQIILESLNDDDTPPHELEFSPYIRPTSR
jgi:hypothetical protein